VASRAVAKFISANERNYRGCRRFRIEKTISLACAALQSTGSRPLSVKLGRQFSYDGNSSVAVGRTADT
jgi:hypothetical protein